MRIFEITITCRRQSPCPCYSGCTVLVDHDHRFTYLAVADDGPTALHLAHSKFVHTTTGWAESVISRVVTGLDDVTETERAVPVTRG